MTRKPILFFDVDGVLAVYERTAYIPDPSGVCLFESEPDHYFRTCLPDTAAIDIARSAKDSGFTVYVLSAVNDDLPWTRTDKLIWLERQLPWMPKDRILLARTGHKVEAVLKAVNAGSLHKNMILIDDWNKNLSDWQDHGGTAVKYLNGLNRKESWPGLCITGRPYDPSTENGKFRQKP